jgi:hypothetical protein
MLVRETNQPPTSFNDSRDAAINSQLTRMSSRLKEQGVRHQNDFDRITDAVTDLLPELEFSGLKAPPSLWKSDKPRA